MRRRFDFPPRPRLLACPAPALCRPSYRREAPATFSQKVTARIASLGRRGRIEREASDWEGYRRGTCAAGKGGSFYRGWREAPLAKEVKEGTHAGRRAHNSSGSGGDADVAHSLAGCIVGALIDEARGMAMNAAAITATYTAFILMSKWYRCTSSPPHARGAVVLRLEQQLRKRRCQFEQSSDWTSDETTYRKRYGEAWRSKITTMPPRRSGGEGGGIGIWYKRKLHNLKWEY